MKLIVITGVSRGLGKSLLDNLLEIQDVFVLGISRSSLPTNYTEHKRFDFLKMDLNDVDHLTAHLSGMKKEQISNLKTVTFINNAGIISPIGQIENMKDEDIKTNVNVNFTAPLLIINYLKKKWSNVKVVNISSGAANRPIDGWGLYCATKAGVKMFCDVFALSNQKNVLNIDPGVMDTAMQQEIRKSSVEEFPGVERFELLKQENKLKSPNQAAKEIIMQLQKGDFI